MKGVEVGGWLAMDALGVKMVAVEGCCGFTVLGTDVKLECDRDAHARKTGSRIFCRIGASYHHFSHSTLS